MTRLRGRRQMRVLVLLVVMLIPRVVLEMHLPAKVVQEGVVA